MWRRLSIGILFIMVNLLVAGTETEIQYLSGTDKDHTVNWEFFCTGGRQSGQWTTIPVPSCWELQGFGVYNYGHDRNPGDEKGLYRYTFAVPAAWKDKQVEIVFEGSMTDTEVKINGKLAGPMHQGAFYRFKYNITALVKFGQKNLLEVTVSKRSANESVNLAERRADYWVFGGIFRPVYLMAKPIENIERVAINAQADGSFAIEVYLGPTRKADRLFVQLRHIDGTPLGRAAQASIKKGQNPVTLTSQLPNPLLWSAETPNLYLAEVSLYGQMDAYHIIREKFGFRTIEIRPGKGLFINNQAVKIIGANRHSFWPESGRTLSRQISIDDVNLMKDMNMNAVRMSHYPPDKHFLEVCDSLGLYVLDELAGWQDAYDTTVGEKLVKALVTRDVNHPCIILWDNGNEGGFNYDLVDDYHLYDPQKRAVMHPWEPSFGINTSHYQDFETYQALAHGPDLVMPTEVLHGLYDGGHGAGLADYWALVQREPQVIGGFLWALVDEGVVRTDQDGKIDKFGNNAPDGIVGPFREKEASYYTIKEIVSPVLLKTKTLDANFTGAIEVENRYSFTNLSECKFYWSLANFRSILDKQSGYEVQKADHLASPDIPPGKSDILKLNLPENFRQYDVLMLRAIDPFGRLIYEWSFPFTQPIDFVKKIVKPATKKAIGSVKDGKLSITNGEVVMAFGNRGRIQSILYKGQPVSFKNGPNLISGGTRPATEKHYAEGNHYVLEVKFHSANYEWLKWTAFGNGWFRLEYRYNLHGYYDFMGISFNYPEEKVTGMRWLGKGPYRVWKNRLAGVTDNVWEKKYNDGITGENWIYPEFKGCYANLSWLELQTQEVPIYVLTETDDLFFRVFTPGTGVDPRYTKVDFPGGDISFLHGIAPIGTKFRPPINLGPQSMTNHAQGVYSGTLYFYFGELTE